VAWTEQHPESAPASLLRVRRFAYDGTPLGEPVDVANGVFSSAMAARGDDVLLAWFGGKTGAAIVHAGGGVQNVSLPDLSGPPAVAAGRDGWMIVAGEQGSVTAVRVDANGNASPARALVPLNADVAVASDGDRYLVAWSTDMGVGTTTCNFVPCGTRAELLDATGGTLASGIPISGRIHTPSLAFAGGEYLLSGSASVRLNRDGMPIGDVALPYVAHLAAFGDAVLAAWQESNGIHVQVVDHGAPGDETVVEAALGTFALTSNAIVTNTQIDGVTAVVFRSLLNSRRRAAR
jgi:hypothetical protein